MWMTCEAVLLRAGCVFSDHTTGGAYSHDKSWDRTPGHVASGRWSCDWRGDKYKSYDHLRSQETAHDWSYRTTSYELSRPLRSLPAFCACSKTSLGLMISLLRTAVDGLEYIPLVLFHAISSEFEHFLGLLWLGNKFVVPVLLELYTTNGRQPAKLASKHTTPTHTHPKNWKLCFVPLYQCLFL